MGKKVQKIFIDSEVVASENAAINCFYQGQNTCYQQSMG